MRGWPVTGASEGASSRRRWPWRMVWVSVHVSRSRLAFIRVERGRGSRQASPGRKEDEEVGPTKATPVQATGRRAMRQGPGHGAQGHATRAERVPRSALWWRGSMRSVRERDAARRAT
jgi:hypothetical protein